MRRSHWSGHNVKLGDWTEWARKKSNLVFFSEALRVMDTEFQVGNKGLMTIGFIGSRDLPGVALRQAQSVLRWDRRPSLWSHVFLIAEPWDGESNVGELRILEVPVHARVPTFRRPEANGLVESLRLSAYKDRELDANVALVTVCRIRKAAKGGVGIVGLDDQEAQTVAQRALDPNHDRLRFDLWDSLCAWQRYLWSDGEARNPLKAGVPVCASAYVEMAFEGIGLDLVPGASERNSAPEHIWNAAVWWHQGGDWKKADTELEEIAHVMTGCFAIRDRGCAVRSADRD